jgi:hypothetical protein
MHMKAFSSGAAEWPLLKAIGVRSPEGMNWKGSRDRLGDGTRKIFAGSACPGATVARPQAPME